jgi:hypothetical protein
VLAGGVVPELGGQGQTLEALGARLLEVHGPLRRCSERASRRLRTRDESSAVSKGLVRKSVTPSSRARRLRSDEVLAVSMTIGR